MREINHDQDTQSENWQRVDARILGQILAAQNLLFVLPDEARIAQFFSEALSKVPGITSCFVCLGSLPAAVGVGGQVCSTCLSSLKNQGETVVLPYNFSCELAASDNRRSIRVGTHEQTFGFFIFQTDISGLLEPYWPFLENLANYVALSLENRRQRLLLEKARDELEAANKELETFAYTVSHDLRAPLRHIDSFLELLQRRMAGTLDERSRHYMDTISESARRMGELIDDLLSFSRMARSGIAKRPVDLGRLVQEIAREFEPEMQGRSIHWRIADLPTVTGDQAMLRVVLVNFLANALKFTRGCMPAEIEIGCRVGEKETVIFIRDNGVGFDMAYADKLFGVFQRLHRADEFEGTGIGLATVRQIIQRHGGRVWAEGQINQGAAFYFSLPHTVQGA